MLSFRPTKEMADLTTMVARCFEIYQYWVFSRESSLNTMRDRIREEAMKLQQMSAPSHRETMMAWSGSPGPSDFSRPGSYQSSGQDTNCTNSFPQMGRCTCEYHKNDSEHHSDERAKKIKHKRRKRTNDCVGESSKECTKGITQKHTKKRQKTGRQSKDAGKTWDHMRSSILEWMKEVPAVGPESQGMLWDSDNK